MEGPRNLLLFKVEKSLSLRFRWHAIDSLVRVITREHIFFDVLIRHRVTISEA